MRRLLLEYASGRLAARAAPGDCGRAQGEREAAEGESIYVSAYLGEVTFLHVEMLVDITLPTWVLILAYNGLTLAAISLGCVGFDTILLAFDLHWSARPLRAALAQPATRVRGRDPASSHQWRVAACRARPATGRGSRRPIRCALRYATTLYLCCRLLLHHRRLVRAPQKAAGRLPPTAG